VQAPFLFTVNAEALLATWPPPAAPNGAPIIYELWLAPGSLAQADGGPAVPGITPGERLVAAGPGTRFVVRGLAPYTQYSLHVRAANPQAAAASPWATARTAGAPPAGLGAPEVRRTAAGLLARWSPPAQPNGIIASYQVRGTHGSGWRPCWLLVLLLHVRGRYPPGLGTARSVPSNG